jgi:hypothetical protein
MATGTLVSNVIFAIANVVAGGLLVVSALMTAFAVVGQALLKVRRIRASRLGGEPSRLHAGSPATSGAAVWPD